MLLFYIKKIIKDFCLFIWWIEINVLTLQNEITITIKNTLYYGSIYFKRKRID